MILTIPPQTRSIPPARSAHKCLFDRYYFSIYIGHCVVARAAPPTKAANNSTWQWSTRHLQNCPSQLWTDKNAWIDIECNCRHPPSELTDVCVVDSIWYVATMVSLLFEYVWCIANNYNVVHTAYNGRTRNERCRKSMQLPTTALRCIFLWK
eukprot:m.1394089 g.1394089  ORF g.1394089 m.1394089 type:complete len:152 (+) comp24992_c0_seq86:318-773(+)